MTSIRVFKDGNDVGPSLCDLASTQTLTGTKTFSNLSVTGTLTIPSGANLNVAGTINIPTRDINTRNDQAASHNFVKNNLDNYYNKTEIDALLKTINDNISNNYVSNSTLTGKNYATESYVTSRGYATTSQLPSLSGYATESYVTSRGYATWTDTKTYIDNRVSYVSNWVSSYFLQKGADITVRSVTIGNWYLYMDATGYFASRNNAQSGKNGTRITLDGGWWTNQPL